VAPRKEQSEPLHLHFRQPNRSLMPVSSRSLNQIAAITAKGPDPNGSWALPPGAFDDHTRPT
jgi:hypothetical protein